MAGNGKKTLSTYVEPELAEFVETEAKLMRVSTSAVLRWAIVDRYADALLEAVGVRVINQNEKEPALVGKV